MFSMPDAMGPGANPLESSLIGVREVKLPCFLSAFAARLPLIPVGHSLLFAVDAVAAA